MRVLAIFLFCFYIFGRTSSEEPSGPVGPPGPPGPTASGPEDCGPLETFLEDTYECHTSCFDLNPDGPRSICHSSSGCFCIPDYVRRDRNGRGPCVPEESCLPT